MLEQNVFFSHQNKLIDDHDNRHVEIWLHRDRFDIHRSIVVVVVVVVVVVAAAAAAAADVVVVY